MNELRAAFYAFGLTTLFIVITSLANYIYSMDMGFEIIILYFVIFNNFLFNKRK